ncbi:MAG: penicillin-binding transpeptidase domain-containing protein [Eubacteriales bacterium]|nr:penicillin-binding transpeptidase domain-containing protein [Eubacteriales bacterium]
MLRTKTYHKKKIVVVFLGCALILFALMGRLGYLMIFQSEYYSEKAQELHERERDIKAARGRILDANGVVLADNKAVCTISVIHNQIKEPEKVIEMLVKELGLPEENVRKRVEKYSSIERIKTNVEKEVGDRIREYNYSGVKVDEDFKRYYPLDCFASKVLGFTGSDNQGIIGLETVYDEVLQGQNGKILTLTDARGVELEDQGEVRLEAVPGQDLYLSIDVNIQKYAEQAAYQVMEQKSADRVEIILMNPQNGEIYAMVNAPEFDLNDPFTVEGSEGMSEEELQNARNQMWRNGCINDTYEPGSTFKIITAAAGLEEGVVTPSDSFFCPGYKIVDDRRIRCHKTAGHGAESFVEATRNSCNPVFIEVGLRLGTERFYHYFEQFGLLSKTGIDVPGEAGTIMHQQEKMGNVELATCAFGQSFQITPLQLITTVSSLINGGTRITPHFGVKIQSSDQTKTKILEYQKTENIVSEETSKTLRTILEQVVDGGSGKNAYIAGYHIGGKTATSETLPRSANKYISSFLGFAPANDPKVIGICVIHNPQGVYYGGTIAAPVIRDIFANIFPYLGIERDPMAQETESE